MTDRVLYVSASPRGEDSTSRKIGDAVIDGLRSAGRNIEVDRLDLWDEDLPEMGPEAVAGRYKVLGGQEVDRDESAAWQRVVDQAERLRAASVLLVSSPMWNFSVPYRLKHWLDLVIQPRYTFSFDPASGYSGLAGGRPAVLALSRAGEYAGDSAIMDHQQRYLELAIGFMGYSNARPIVLEPSFTGDAEEDAARLAAATSEAGRVAAEVAARLQESELSVA